MEDKVHEEFLYYLAHQDELVELYNGKVIVLHDHEVAGAYGSYGEAHREAIKRFPIGSYLLQLCTPGDRAYTIRAHSRVLLRNPANQ